MKRLTLTKDQIQSIRNIDNNGAGDRAGAYLELWQITGDPEALQQARIASFSGGLGGAAFGANLEIQKSLGAKYPGVFYFSDQVFQSSMDNIDQYVPKINSGELSLSSVMFEGAKQACGHVELPNGQHEDLSPDFPGNLFAWNPASSNRFDVKAMTSPGAAFAVEGETEANLYGKSLSDFDGLPGFSRHTLTDISGASVVTIKDDRTGRTVYVGTGGDTLQIISDFGLLGDIKCPLQTRIGNDDYPQREKFKAIRQNEEPDTLSISPSGILSVIRRAVQNAPIGLPPRSATDFHATILANSPWRRFGPLAPVSGQRKPEKETPADKNPGAADAFPPSVQQIMQSLSAYAKYVDSAATEEGLAPISKYARALANAPAASVGRFRQALLAEVTRSGNKFKALAQGRPGSPVSKFLSAQKRASLFAPLAVGKQRAAPALSKLLTSVRAPLPAVAPVGGRRPAVMSTGQLISHHSGPDAPGASQRSAADRAGRQKIEQQNLRLALDELFHQQGRLPPSGASAFDPLLTPAWPALQQPAVT